ncbi:MAG: DUF445 domain-containing protein [Hydrogenophaga sp.]
MSKPQTPSVPWSLGRMKVLALALLLMAAVVYVGATLMGDRHPAWGYVAAAAEAAMIGALADWFAVVALFRHPLGLPIPHTRILPANKDRLGQRLAEFLDQHFLTRDRVDDALSRWDMSGDLVGWLAVPANRARVADGLADALPDVLAALRREPVPGWVARASRRLVRELDVAALGGQALQALTEHRHHQRWFDSVAGELADWAARESVQEHLTEAIARELAKLRYVGLDQVAARLATRKLVAALTRMLAEAVADPQHVWRLRFDAWMSEAAQRLQGDAAWQAQAAGWRDTWLAQPRWDEAVQAWWIELAERLRTDLRAPDSRLVERLGTLLDTLVDQLAGDQDLRQGLNRQMRQALLSALDRSRPAIVDFVAERVRAWDADEMGAVLETHIGRDLQFIRINGTVVGALVGVLLHAATQWWLR